MSITSPRNRKRRCRRTNRRLLASSHPQANTFPTSLSHSLCASSNNLKLEGVWVTAVTALHRAQLMEEEDSVGPREISHLDANPTLSHDYPTTFNKRAYPSLIQQSRPLQDLLDMWISEAELAIKIAQGGLCKRPKRTRINRYYTVLHRPTAVHFSLSEARRTTAVSISSKFLLSSNRRSIQGV